ncbi:MAG: ABC transporter permease [Coriobacteriia bacterium]|nr:ABC transporter permease [Coriobacteriia bacterium]
MIEAIIHYFQYNSTAFLLALWQHVYIASVAVSAAVLVGFPLGVLSARNKRMRSFVTGTFSALRVIPSLALLFLIVIMTGMIGVLAAVLALTILALPVILINTTVAFSQLPDGPVEAAASLGFTPWQVFWHIKLPLALPLIFAGIKTAAAEVVASTTLAAFIGGGGLGTLIFTGLSIMRTDLLLIGGISAAALSLAILALLNVLERFLMPWKYLRT